VKTLSLWCAETYFQTVGEEQISLDMLKTLNNEGILEHCKFGLGTILAER